jgi:acetyl esterase/lipase
MPTVAYGPHPDQVGELYLPAGGGPFPVVVLLHGGNWAATYDRSQLVPLALDLTGHGIAAWNVEFRRVGYDGGWPATFLDVAAAVDALPGMTSVDPARVVTVGHSAGGQLALWAAARSLLPAAAPGCGPRVMPVGAVSLAGLLDLVAADGDGYGIRLAKPGGPLPPGAPVPAHPERAVAVSELVDSGIVPALLGGRAGEVPERYAWASPSSLVPTGVPTLAVHGEVDAVVTAEYSRSYYREAVGRGAPAELVVVPGAGHFDVVDPGHSSWVVARDWVLARLGA